jgi:hypothetical protein
LPSLGWSTLVQIVEASEQDYLDVVRILADCLVKKFGAPSLTDAEIAAEAEVAFSSSLCAHPLDTLIALHRSEENGEIRETFRSLQRKAGPKPLRAFAFLEVEEEGEDAAEQVDLTKLGQQKSDQ